MKSGGHARSAGESNADGGITIDLKYFNGIEVSEDQLTTYVGTANRWGEVFDVLDPLGLTVVGGRKRDVGLGGYLLGGRSCDHGHAFHKLLICDRGHIFSFSNVWMGV